MPNDVETSTPPPTPVGEATPRQILLRRAAGYLELGETTAAGGSCFGPSSVIVLKTDPRPTPRTTSANATIRAFTGYSFLLLESSVMFFFPFFDPGPS